MKDLENIKNLVESYLDYNLYIKSKVRKFVYARTIFYKLAEKHTKHPLKTIAKFINEDYDHCDVIYARKVFKTVEAYEKEIFKAYQEIDEILSYKPKQITIQKVNLLTFGVM